MSQQIIPMITSALVTSITATCQTAISGSDITRAVSVKRGRWQDDPTRKFVYVTVCGGDPEDPKFQDGIVSLGTFENISYMMPAREIGGGQLWWRRGIIQVGCYFLRQGLDEDDAINAAYVVLGRLQSCIESTVVSNLTDDFGEHAIQLFCFADSFFESGGPPTSYIFRGRVYWSCLTERE